MNYTTEMNIIEAFCGKRNTVITLFIPPNLKITKSLEPIQRQIKAIKHSNKRGQINQVVNCIINNNSTVDKYNGKGMIICAGLGKDNKVTYVQIIPNKLVEKVQYYYDDTFHIDLIRTYIYSDSIIFIPCAQNDTNKINKGIVDGTNIYTIGEDIKKGFQLNLIKTIYFFGSDIIPKDLLDNVIKNNVTICKFDSDDIYRKDFQKKYGDVVGELYYSQEFNEE